MSAGAAMVLLSVVLAVVIVRGLGAGRGAQPKRVGGLLGKDRKGRTTLVIWPSGRKGKR